MSRLLLFLLPLALVSTAAAAPTFVSAGKTYRLVENDASRLLFKEKELRGREFVLTGTAAKDGLSVTAVRAVVKGKEFDVYNRCENCQLAYSEPGNCQRCNSDVKRVEVEAGAKGGLPKLIKPNWHAAPRREAAGKPGGLASLRARSQNRRVRRRRDRRGAAFFASRSVFYYLDDR